jgi:hypothetical protein
MKKAVKAALLSGLVFPGLGQVYLKRYWRGAIIMLFTFSAFGFIIVTATMSALENLKKMQSQGPVDMGAVSDLAASATVSSSLSYNILLLLVACCWLFSIIDSYVIGRKSLDKEG